MPLLLWANWEIIAQVTPVPISNPFTRLLFIDHPIHHKDGGVSYRKGYNVRPSPGRRGIRARRANKQRQDLWFLAYWVVCMSFIRLFWTVWVLHPIARWYGIRSEAKVIRFGEQGYAVVYFTVMGTFGLVRPLCYLLLPLTMVVAARHVAAADLVLQLHAAMDRCALCTRVQRHSHGADYPQWDMTPALKSYYLLHFAYWLQQFLVLALRLEKPRSDYTELVIHHIVTLWLIG